MPIFHLPLRGSQSNLFIFEIIKPDTNSAPLLPILLQSKAETRYVHGMGALRHQIRAPQSGPTLHE